MRLLRTCEKCRYQGFTEELHCTAFLGSTDEVMKPLKSSDMNMDTIQHKLQEPSQIPSRSIPSLCHVFDA